MSKDLLIDHSENSLVLSNKFDILEALIAFAKESDLFRRIMALDMKYNDLLSLEINFKGKMLWRELIDKELEIIFLELLDELSDDFYGREYLSKSRDLIETLASKFKTKNKEQKNLDLLLPIIQKLSLRPQIAEIFIAKGSLRVLYIIISQNKSREGNLQSFALGLLLNLSQNKNSQMELEDELAGQFMEFFIDNIDSFGNNRSYVNAVIFELLNFEMAKKVANNLGLREITEMESEVLVSEELGHQSMMIHEKLVSNISNTKNSSNVEDIKDIILESQPSSNLNCPKDVLRLFEKYSLEDESNMNRILQYAKSIEESIKIEAHDISFNVTNDHGLKTHDKDKGIDSKISMGSMEYSELTMGTINPKNNEKSPPPTHLSSKPIARISKLGGQ